MIPVCVFVTAINGNRNEIFLLSKVIAYMSIHACHPSILDACKIRLMLLLSQEVPEFDTFFKEGSLTKTFIHQCNYVAWEM